MKKNYLLILFALALCFFTISCWEDPIRTEAEASLQLPPEPFKYSDVQLPEHFMFDFGRFNNNVFPNSVSPEFSQEQSSFMDLEQILISNESRVFDEANPIVTDRGATLGRVLFYDAKLSLNNSIACASCHRQQNAFADPNQFSKGFGGKTTPRNSMAITNAALNNNMFWDSRVHSVLKLALEPVQNHIEMGMESIPYLEKKLAKTSYYPELFAQAFGDPAVTGDRIANALAQFVCALTSIDAKFDDGQKNNFANYSDLELMGKELFFSSITNCSGCHSGPNFAAADFPGGEYSEPDIQGTASIGLDLVSNDPGLGEGKFRIPSLRNVMLTAPYMHDGRFETLEEVLEHYNSRIQAHPALDDKLKDERGLPLRMNLNSLEKKALIAFLHTLTDRSLTIEEKYSDPFRY